MRADGTVAISSQENAQVWVGKFKLADDGFFALDVAEFDDDVGEVYDFPRSVDGCSVEYCNVEGIHFTDNDRLLLAVSDKMKSRGKQNYKCLGKDQSAHVFSLP
uniref:Uncharacterized protein n=2 Tax=Phaeomonas parva TaxID=124430 RepID=A0A7S1TPZ5_9STRA|mmetsp:Transcript_12486/g.37510  ORF Transcript_12486/g.37510 Transcript_12486/m.37510 type:complete len:104 (+) Transcript_12486:633-944(+)